VEFVLLLNDKFNERRVPVEGWDELIPTLITAQPLQDDFPDDFNPISTEVEWNLAVGHANTLAPM